MERRLMEHWMKRRCRRGAERLLHATCQLKETPYTRYERTTAAAGD